ncbi:MAG: bifunctional folylpolyglutamate synthase/dihydrofolate synthase [Spirochaetaceae bacterium]|nr:MAG: bifunctional folylpolyglutamate synthase/dihydrofolate synthase [Spirochaetaceae bacterium]
MTFTNFDDAFSWVESFTNLERGGYRPREYRLDRMEKLLDAFGRPERASPVFHVAGSKGKGTTAAFVASILTAAGHKTGLYTSPHVVSYRERIKLSDDFFPDDFLVRVVSTVAEYVEQYASDPEKPEIWPTTFELLTLIGFLAFREYGCTFAVIEVGIGGRLDATNVVTPVMSVITPIEREHTEYLGDTIELIAREKAGIIKPGLPVTLGALSPAAEAVCRSVAESHGSRVYSVRDLNPAHDVVLTSEGAFFEFRAPDAASPQRSTHISTRMSTRMCGVALAENALLAATAVSLALPEIPREALVEGVRSAFLPGRREVFPGAPPIMFDGAHTPDSVRRLSEDFRAIFPGPAVLVFGSVAGKDHETMAEILASDFRSVIVSRPGTFKKSEPELVFASFESRNHDTVLVPDASDALAAAQESGLPVLVTGSFFLVAEIRSRYVAELERNRSYPRGA